MNNFNKLREWLHLENDNLMMNEDGFRGIYSTKDIYKDDIIIEIPDKNLIQYSNIKKNRIESKLYNTNSSIAMYMLLQSLTKNSYWKNYLDTLPKSLDEYIYYYDEKKINLLKHTSMMCKSVYNFNTHMKNIINDSKIIYNYLLNKNKLCDEIKDYDNFYKLFLKFRILACSRIFGYMKNSEHDTGMVPYADLLNHSENPNTTWKYDDSKKAFIVIATKYIPKKTEIFDSYGNKSNVQLMMYYGFSIKDNKNSSLFVKNKHNLIELNYNNSSKPLSKDDIHKLKKILKHHEYIIKNKHINDINILNIYNDEIQIIKTNLKYIH